MPKQMTGVARINVRNHGSGFSALGCKGAVLTNAVQQPAKDALAMPWPNFCPTVAAQKMTPSVRRPNFQWPYSTQSAIMAKSTAKHGAMPAPAQYGGDGGERQVYWSRSA